MRASRLAAAALVAAVAVASAGSAVATVFLKVDMPALKKMSEAVVHAKVVDISSEWNAERTMIFTHVTLDVKGRLHGAAADRIVVRVPGGTVDDFSVAMEGAPEFTLNDEVVAFISRWRDGVPMVAGYVEGVSRVHQDGLGNKILKGGLADGLPISELTRQLRSAR